MVSARDIQDHTCICWHVDLTTHSQPGTHTHIRKQEVLLSGLHYSPSVVQSGGEPEGGLTSKETLSVLLMSNSRGWSVSDG